MSAEYREPTTSAVLLAKLYLTQAKMPLAFLATQEFGTKELKNRSQGPEDLFLLVPNHGMPTPTIGGCGNAGPKQRYAEVRSHP